MLVVEALFIIQVYLGKLLLLGMLAMSQYVYNVQWGVSDKNKVTLPIAYTKYYCVASSVDWGYAAVETTNLITLTFVDIHSTKNLRYIVVGI